MFNIKMSGHYNGYFYTVLVFDIVPRVYAEGAHVLEASKDLTMLRSNMCSFSYIASYIAKGHMFAICHPNL